MIKGVDTERVKNWDSEQPMNQIKITGEIKFPETKRNGIATYQNFWNAAKTILRENFIVISAYIKKQERSQVT